LTEVDCTDAEGNYQGDDTHCDEETPCTGACCYDTGGCFEDMTKADCETGEGMFQDYGSTCDDTSCTGACCQGEGCYADMTKADCEGGVIEGGIFQGIDSVCVPNPCTLPACGSCYYGGYLGIGKYLRVTDTCSGTYNQTTGGWASSWNSGWSRQKIGCDDICDSFYGSGTCHGGDSDCSGTVSAGGCQATSCLCYGNCGFSLITVSSGYLQWNWSGDDGCEPGCFGCSNFLEAWLWYTTTIYSDTVIEYRWYSTYGGTALVDVTDTRTLSEPCILV
jgi:hypothetical protein